MIIDCHVHINSGWGRDDDRMADMIHFADRVGIDALCLSLGYSRDQTPSPEVVEGENDLVWKEVERRPDRIIGFCYLNPGHLEHSLAEMDRCIANGPFRGIKLWIALPCDHPNLDPIAERAAELGAPILQH
ncbi:MAG: amidohydrolase family protein, partial [Armatimonadetes bacterium]|nr:amidohydrolase family protein [Armatimonadota bacterium]